MAKQEGMRIRKAENFSEWYLELVAKSDIVDSRVPVKGANVILPTGMGIWKTMMDKLDEMLLDNGVQNYYFPMFIPERLLKKESEHFKGFIPEVAWVTMAGNRKLDEKMAIRPTSEIIMYEMFKLWIRSYTDLPLKVNQYVNIVRWDTKMTKPLIRDREFLWHETHTAHATKEDYIEESKRALYIYNKLISGMLNIPYLEMERPSWDRFPGAEESAALDAVMPDGKLIQIGTVHSLGLKFSKALGIKFLDNKGKKQYPYQTSYGVTTRLLGALVAIHGDDKGLIIPPTVAPIQAVIVPIFTPPTKADVYKKCGEILATLATKGFRIHLDDREGITPGFKFNEWELKGVPVRIEIGPRDIEKSEISLVRRDFKERISIPEEKLEEQLLEILDSIGFQLEKRAFELMKITDANDYKEIKKALKQGGFVRIPFCMKEECANKLKKDTTAEIRGTLIGKEEKVKDKCAICNKKAVKTVYIGKSY